MLAGFLDYHPASYLTTYTRNPAVLKMLRHVTSELYPLDNNTDLRAIALRMPHSTHEGNAVYHFNRYDKDGLFQTTDPADMPIEGRILKDHFTKLKNVRHALVVAARTAMEIDT